MTTQKDEKKKRFLLNCAYLAAVLAVAWLVFRYLLGWIMPFIIGYLIAAVIQPAVFFLHNKFRIKRKAAGMMTVLFFIAAAGLLITFAITKIITELADVLAQLPYMINQVSIAVSHLFGNISGYIDSMPVEVSQKLSNLFANMSDELMKLTSLSSGTFSLIFNIISMVPGLLLDIIIIIVSACFISMDYVDIRGFILRQLPKKYQDWVCDLKEYFFITLAKMIRAYLILMGITFAELSLGLTVIGVGHPITVAALIAIVDILPVLGTGTVMIPWFLIELLIGKTLFGVELLILYAIIMVVRNILEPKIVGGHIGLYPLITLMSMFIGLKCLGAVGIFLFPIIIILLKHMQETGKIRIWKD